MAETSSGEGVELSSSKDGSLGAFATVTSVAETPPGEGRESCPHFSALSKRCFSLGSVLFWS